MVTCQSANHLKTPAKFSWVSQFGSLGYTIMGKTVDLTVVQKTIIDTLHKEGKPQTFIAKEAGCSQSAVSKHVNRKLSGRKKCGRKRCTTNRENCSLMRIVKQNRFRNLGELHKEWTEAGVKASRATTRGRPIIGADIKHLTNYRYRPFSKQICRLFFFIFFYNANKHTIYRWHYLLVTK